MAKGKFGKLVALSTIVGAGAWVFKKYDTIKSMYHKVSIFKGDHYEFDEFEGEAIAAMFSGVMIDLSDVVFSEDEVYLDLYGLCSGIKVLIPKDVEVVLEGTNNASGVQIDQNEDIPKTRTLYINYNITASGLQITDNVDDAYDDDPCSDSACTDPNCCSDDQVADDLEDLIVEEDLSDDLEDLIVEEDLSDDLEPFADKLEEVEEEVEETLESLKDEIVEDVELNKRVHSSAQELEEAAEEVEEAIDDFVNLEEDFDDSDLKADDEDDFFE